MNHQDKFWEAFQDKVKGYSTDEYSPAEWTAMEQLLASASGAATEKPAATKPWWMWWAVGLVLLLAGGLFFWSLADREVENTTYTLSQNEVRAAGQKAASNSATAPAQEAVAANTPRVADQAEGVAIAASTASVPPVTVVRQDRESSANAPAKQASTIAPEEQGVTPGLPLAELIAPADPASTMNQSEELLSAETATAPVVESEFVRRPATEALATLEISPLAQPEKALATRIKVAPQRQPSRRWQPSLIVGGNLLPANTGRSGQMAGGPMGGLAVRRSLSPRWSVEVEAVARAVLNYDLTLAVSDTYINPTGGQEQSHEESRTIRDYLSVDLPIVFHYATHSRWSLTTGLRYSYLFPTDTYGVSRFRGVSEEVLARINAPQIWQNDFGLLLGVAYELSPRWSVQLRYTQSWVDLSPDNVYQDTQTHLNSDLQITTRKYF